jgi:dipeptidase E
VKLLLTSAGVTNPSIKDALVDLLGKPIADASALCIPTAMYGHPHVGPGEGVWRFISGQAGNPMTELGWKSLGVLELTALPSIDEERWVPLVRDTDVLLASGGDALYLCHWMRESGLVDLLPSLSETVWVGMSAGSMVMTPRIGEDFVGWKPPHGDDSTLGLVDFSICPHLADELGLEALHLDALHMQALVAEPAESVELIERALAMAAVADDVRARNWDASLLNNLGMLRVDAPDLDGAAEAFTAALAARERIGVPADIRVARWMVAWVLRLQGRNEDALAIQRELKAELDAAGAADPYVEEELALLKPRPQGQL